MNQSWCFISEAILLLCDIWGQRSMWGLDSSHTAAGTAPQAVTQLVMLLTAN